MTKQQKIEDTALLEEGPAKGVKRKAEAGGADTEKDTAPPAKDSKVEEHVASGAGEPKAEVDARRPLKGGHPKGELEEGRIFFLYKPRVGLPDAESVSDIQRLYMILAPSARSAAEGGGDAAQPKPKARLLVIAKKVLPDPKRHDRFFGFVQAVADSVEDLVKGLGPNDYETKTSGSRHQEGARVVGEGVYSIGQKGKRDTRLVYRLEVPEEPGPVQKALRIGKEGNILISIKNPTKRNPPGAGLSEKSKAEFPPEKMAEFEGGPPGGYAWIPASDTSLLDFPRCELLLIGTQVDAEGIGEDVEKHLKEAVEKDREDVADYGGDDEDKALVERLRQELHADIEAIKMEPVLTGGWA